MTIDDKRISDDDIREKVLVYKRECYGVLFQHFHKGAKPLPVDVPDDMEAHESEGVRVRMVTEARQTFGSRASGQLWFQLGLPVVPAMMEQKRQFDLLDYERVKTTSDAA